MRAIEALRAGCLLALFFAPVIAAGIAAGIVATAVARWAVGQ